MNWGKVGCGVNGLNLDLSFSFSIKMNFLIRKRRRAGAAANAFVSKSGKNPKPPVSNKLDVSTNNNKVALGSCGIGTGDS